MNPYCSFCGFAVCRCPIKGMKSSTPEKAPEKPNQAEFDLCSLGRVKQISSEFIQTSGTEGETWWTLTGSAGDTLKVTDHMALHYLEFRPRGTGSIAELKSEFRKKVNAWNNYIKKNKQDYETYLHLKEQFGETEEGT
jgi:hypothetical protein